MLINNVSSSIFHKNYVTPWFWDSSTFIYELIFIKKNPWMLTNANKVWPHIRCPFYLKKKQTFSSIFI